MNLVKATGTIGGLTLVSRIAGFGREMLMSRIMGASAAADAFLVAFRLPNTFRRLFGEGAFSAGFVPLFSQRLHGEGGFEDGRRFSEEVLAVLLPTLFLFTLVFELAMPLFVVVGGIVISMYLPLFSLIVPAWMVCTMSGWRGLRGLGSATKLHQVGEDVQRIRRAVLRQVRRRIDLRQRMKARIVREAAEELDVRRLELLERVLARDRPGHAGIVELARDRRVHRHVVVDRP